MGDRRTPERIDAELRRRRSDLGGLVFRTVLQVGLILALLVLCVLLVDVVRDGWSVLSTRLGDFLSGTLRSRSVDEQLGVHQGLVGSFWIAVFTAVLAFPIGIGAAIYLEEFAPRNRITRFVDLNIRNLAGVPSVVYGLLGLFLFVSGLKWFTGGKTLLSAGLTLAILVLPIVIITASEAIRAVPDSLREGAYGVGATRWEVVRNLVLPYAAPGILTGTLLAMSRAIGEAAPLILVGAVTGRLGSDPGFLDLGALTERFVAMPIVITEWTQNSGRDIGFAAAAAAAIVVLLAFVLTLNSAAILLRNRFEKRRR
jgi:phosphate transport system permease protein|tara:strand:+ start:979 stop:1917 length:939 start_codon:yes stop_codon:yes gene_type:complete